MRGNLSIFIFVVVIAAAVSTAAAKTTHMTFENGMEVIFRENHSSPMITSIVFVKAGAKYETEFNNGITHFLEHLLFDGTKNRSREEISDGVENHGGYINAFTRKDLTGFLILMPSEYIEFGLEIQADQLFNSIFPEEELPKERKVVIEEIQMNNDDESTIADYFFNAKSMAGTPYERPVLGYKNIIASIPRQNIIDYWNHYYAPNNMIAMVIGDFDTDGMIEMYRRIFGAIPPVELPSPPEVSYFAPKEKAVYKKAGDTKMTYIQVGVDAPHFTDPDYYAFDLIAEYLNSDENSPLVAVFKDADGNPLQRSFSVSLEMAEEFSRLIINVTTDDEAKSDAILAGIDNVLSNFKDYQPDKEILNGIIVSKKANEIYLEEKLHYYGFMIAPMLVTTGYEFLETYLDAIEKVNPTMMVRAADRWMKDLKYTAAVYYPKKEVPKEEREQAHTTYRREVFPNGLTVVVKSNADSRVFALNVIGKNRSALEPPMEIGITDFVNRMIEKGTTTHNAEELAQKLAEIGANVTLYDNPWIPYDDRYTTRQYAFMKFETIDDYTSEGLALFADMIKHPAFDSAEVEQVRGVLMGILGKESNSPREACRNLFYANLFEGAAFANPVDGSPRTIGSITRDDLTAHHRKFYSPENMIITVGTNKDADAMMTMISQAFGDMEATGLPPVRVETGNPVLGIKAAHQEMDKEQVYIYIGNKLPGAAHPDTPAIELAASILSDRLGKNLREKQGLAYSVGASASFDREFGWYTCAMGTGVDNYEIAREGIIAEIEKLKTEGPTDEEVEIAKNSLWGSSLTRNLSRINQAYYMGVDEYLGVGYGYQQEFIKQLRAVTPEEVKAAADKYFDIVNYVLATAGKI